jgi:hypothetical protein
MGDLLGSLIWGAKSGQYCVIGGGSLHTPSFSNHSLFDTHFNCRPDYTFLWVFGCVCWPNLHPYNSNKFQPLSAQCLFFCYNPCHKGYKCLHLQIGHRSLYLSGCGIQWVNFFMYIWAFHTDFLSPYYLLAHFSSYYFSTRQPSSSNWAGLTLHVISEILIKCLNCKLE